MTLDEEILKKLNKILGKYQRELGILIWGTTEPLEQNDKRALLVDDDGKLVASSS